MELARFELATSWVRCSGERSRPFAPVRQIRTVERNPAGLFGALRSQANVECDHCDHEPYTPNASASFAPSCARLSTVRPA